MGKDMKCLITGSGGLVGSSTVKLFKEKGWQIVEADNNSRSKFFGTKSNGLDMGVDIRNEEEISDLFAEHAPFDAIIHAAAQPSHDWSRDHVLEDFDVNARGTVILLEATRKYCPNATFIHVSTDKVYGTNMAEPYLPYGEDLSIDYAMHSPFGCSKAAADLYVQEYGYYFGIKTTIFRPGCITGRNHQGAEWHGFLSYLTKCVKEQKPYRIFGYRGEQVRDQIHADDLANAFWHVVQNPPIASVYNIGGGMERAISINQAIEMIEKETGEKAIIEYVDEPRKGDRYWDVHDVSEFRKDYPEWDYTYSLEDIIKDLCS